MVSDQKVLSCVILVDCRFCEFVVGYCDHSNSQAQPHNILSYVCVYFPTQHKIVDMYFLINPNSYLFQIS